MYLQSDEIYYNIRAFKVCYEQNMNEEKNKIILILYENLLPTICSLIKRFLPHDALATKEDLKTDALILLIEILKEIKLDSNDYYYFNRYYKFKLINKFRKGSYKEYSTGLYKPINKNNKQLVSLLNFVDNEEIFNTSKSNCEEEAIINNINKYFFYNYIDSEVLRFLLLKLGSKLFNIFILHYGICENHLDICEIAERTKLKKETIAVYVSNIRKILNSEDIRYLFKRYNKEGE